MKPVRAENRLRLALLPIWVGIGFLWLLHGLPLPLQAALGNALADNFEGAHSAGIHPAMRRWDDRDMVPVIAWRAAIHPETPHD